MDAEDIVNKYYRLITLTPGKRVTSISLLIITIMIYVSATSFPARDLGVYVKALILYPIEALLSIAILLTSFKHTHILNFKRSVNLTTAIMLMTLPAEVILSRFAELRGLGLSVSPGLLLFILASLYELRIATLLSLYPIVIVSVAGNLVLGYSLLKTVLLAVSMGSISLLVGVLALYSIEYLGRNRGISPLKSTRAFMRTWLTGNHEDLEELIRSFGVTDRVHIRTLVLRREQGEPIALVFPDIHFGPFRNVGSSRFIYTLEEGLEPSMEVFVFHTPGSHERNIATSSESHEVAKSVASSIRSYYSQLADYAMCKPEIVREGEWEVHVLRGPTLLAYFFTNIHQGNDDLPFSIWRKTEDIFKVNRELNIVAIADSHSAKGPPIKDGEELLHLVERIGSVNKCVEEEVYVGYSEVSGLGCRELCYDKVKVLSFRFSSGEKYALVYLYGNNVDLETRNNITNLMKSLGYNESLVVTPDDHSCAASFKERPYYVVSGCSSLYEAISRAVEKASENESRARYVTLENIFHEVELAGQNIWRLTSLIEDLGRTAMRTLLTTIALSNALAALSIALKF